MATRIAARYVFRRLSSSGKVLSEEKAAENVYIKKMEQENLEKLACKGPKPGKTPATSSGTPGSVAEAKPTGQTSLTPNKESTDSHRLCPDNVARQIKHLKSLGLNEGTAIRILETVPAAIMLRGDKIQEKVGFLKGIGVQKREMDRIFGLLPEILVFGVKNRLKPLIHEFEDLGFSLSRIRREVVRNPKVLGLENGELSQCLEMLGNLKCRHAIKENIFQEGEICAGYEVKLRIDCLRNHGLTYRDAFTVLWKEPRVILYEIGEIEKKIEFLVRKMKFDMQCLVEVPEYLGVNFDIQIVPRFRVIEYLRSQNGLGDEVSLRSLVKPSRLRFYNMYVKPYPECEKIYGRLARDVVRSHHPVGMWKLFLPRKYPESGQDVQNMKSFVELLP